MKKLLKQYGFKSDMHYFEMIVESVINGQRTQAKNQFNAMPRKERKAFVVSIYGSWDSGLSDSEKAFFMNLL